MQDEKYRVDIEEKDDEIRSLRDQLCRCGDSPPAARGPGGSGETTTAGYGGG